MHANYCRTAPEPHNSQFKEALATYHFVKAFFNNTVVLDAGCASGYGTAFIAGQAKKVVGADIDHASLVRASRQKEGRSISFLVTDLARTALKSATFETICLFEVLSTTQDYLRMVQEMNRLLKPKGVLLLSVRRTQDAGAQKTPYAQTTFTPEELLRELPAIGFTVKKIYALHRPAQAYQLEQKLSHIRKLDCLRLRALIPRPVVSFGVYLISRHKHLTPPQLLQDKDFIVTEDLLPLSPGLLLVCEKQGYAHA